jgi:hypothetical protein
MDKINVYLEIGKKRSIAGAIDWPGWSRSGIDETGALQALINYAPRYARVVQTAMHEFTAPANFTAFNVVERLQGNATTDYGVPAFSPSSDARPVGEAELQRLQALLKACWQALNAARLSAGDRELRKGPRGGGRDVAKITRHVLDAESAYLSQLGWKLKPQGDDPENELHRISLEIPQALAAAAHGELPAIGPRGGLRWMPRYYARRAAWHVLDHAWEIEDRIPA